MCLVCLVYVFGVPCVPVPCICVWSALCPCALRPCALCVCVFVCVCVGVCVCGCVCVLDVGHYHLEHCTYVPMLLILYAVCRYMYMYVYNDSRLYGVPQLQNM